MRIILVTGPGGAGRTTVAAATALVEAWAGRRVLLLAADGGTGTVLDDGELPGSLTVLRPETGAGFRREFLAIQSRAGTAFDLLGAAPFEEAELTELPGSRSFAQLRALRDAAAGDHDLVVVDMPVLRDALALLALPVQLRRYLRRLLPPERQAARALRPLLAQLAGVPMPAQWLYESTARWETELAAVQAVVDAPDTTVRLVVEPGPAADEALRTARLGLALQGVALDLVVANRMLPAESGDPWLAGLAARQHDHLARLREAYGSVHPLPHLGRAPGGPRTSPSSEPSGTRRPPSPLPDGPSRTAANRTASSSGTCRCPARSRTTSRSSAAATNSSSPSARSVMPWPCPPRCAAAPSRAPVSSRGTCGSASRRTPVSGREPPDGVYRRR